MLLGVDGILPWIKLDIHITYCAYIKCNGKSDWGQAPCIFRKTTGSLTSLTDGDADSGNVVQEIGVFYLVLKRQVDFPGEKQVVDFLLDGVEL